MFLIHQHRGTRSGAHKTQLIQVMAYTCNNNPIYIDRNLIPDLSTT